MPKPMRPALTQAELLALRHAKVHDRFVDLFQQRRRTRADALRIMEKEFYLTARALCRLLNTPLTPANPVPRP